MEIKLCGLTRNRDARLADELGAAYLGAVLSPRSPRFVAPEALPELFDGCRAKRVGVFVDPEPEFLRRAVELGKLDIVQLHGSEPEELAAGIGFAEVWKAFHLSDASQLPRLLAFPAAAILLDGASGGSGRACDWKLAAELASRRKVILAGGLNSANLGEAARLVRPFAMDVNSGAESSPGVKDETKLRMIFEVFNGLTTGHRKDEEG